MIRTNGFWRDPALPFVEARWVGDGRTISHAAHSHDSFSIGVITGGCNTYRSGDRCLDLRAGATVMMNPGVVHACNPIAGQPWSYLMLYLDMPWLTRQGFALPMQTHSWHPQLYAQVLQTASALFDTSLADTEREARVCQLLNAVPVDGGASATTVSSAHCALDGAAAFIRAHCREPLTLDDIGAACGLSRGYLIRAFGQRFGLTPHGYLVDQRVRYARAQLRVGRSIAEIALEAGFADQAHLQRAFKRHLAATPGDYRGGHRPRPAPDPLLAQLSSR